MKFQIYNTLSRQKELFEPLDKDLVKIYSCGPTVYSTPHIGNLRAAFFADILRNTIRNILGYNLIHVMNITDVGHLVSDADDGQDKMEKGAQREGISAFQVAQKYEKIFKDSLRKLNIAEFDEMPRATEHISEQIDLVKKLELKGYTYQINGDGVYMDTSKVEDYGKLMGPNYQKHLEGLKSGARIEDNGKKNITDFALRKFSPLDQKREMERDSPWGKGFPGWHIECSAMSSKYLGDQFDIHTGGVEHISIHHTDEIAQSECGLEVHPWVKYWMHNQHLQVDGGKMSKSLGNIYSVDSIVENGFDPLDLRFFYLTSQYRNYQNFSRENLKSAQNSRKSIIKKVDNCKDVKNFDSVSSAEDLFSILELQESKLFLQNILDFLLDDLNTSGVLAEINIGLQNPNSEILGIIYRFEKNLLKIGIGQKENIKIIPENIIKLANDRIEAKNQKNYILADQIRNKIQELGFNIKDTPAGFEIE